MKGLVSARLITSTLKSVARQYSKSNLNKTPFNLSDHPTRLWNQFDPEELDHVRTEISQLSPLAISILTKFRYSAMSYGSIAEQPHRDLAKAANYMACIINGADHPNDLLPYMGPKSNSGEGGELPSRLYDWENSSIKQVASGRFGVTPEYLLSAREIEIKVSQGAKPGDGGELPAFKNTPDIAQARGTQPWVSLTSPPPHHDCYSIEDWALLVRDIRATNPFALITIKLAAGRGIGQIAAGMVKSGVDSIVITGDGGTGAAPLISNSSRTLSVIPAFAEVEQTLTAEGLRNNVSLIMEGFGVPEPEKLLTATLLGAEYYGFGTSSLVSLGCVHARKCHSNDCPTGVATQDPNYISKYKGEYIHAVRWSTSLAQATANLFEECGFENYDDAIGKKEALTIRQGSTLTNLEQLLFKPAKPKLPSRFAEDNRPRPSIAENTVIQQVLNGANEVDVKLDNRMLSFGAKITGEMHYSQEFKDAINKRNLTIKYSAHSVGQSFGLMLQDNVTLIPKNKTHGQDFVGKLLYGGRIYISTTGNGTGLGAKKGEIYARASGDRAAVLNSGASLMFETVGAHCANFMCGGSVTVLGAPELYPHVIKDKFDYTTAVKMRSLFAGPNFAAAFSGGKIILPKLGYKLLSSNGSLSEDCLKIAPSKLEDSDFKLLRKQLQNMHKYVPESHLAKELLEQSTGNEHELKESFVKLDPKNIKVQSDYKENTVIIPQVITVDTANTKSHPLRPRTISPHMWFESNKQQNNKGLVDSKQKADCGLALMASATGKPDSMIIPEILEYLESIEHRGASMDKNSCDGVGISLFVTDNYFSNRFTNWNSSTSVLYTTFMPAAHDKCTRVMGIAQKVAQDMNAKLSSSELIKTRRELRGMYRQLKDIEPYFIKIDFADTKLCLESQSIIFSRRFNETMQQMFGANRPDMVGAPGIIVLKELVPDLGAYFPILSDEDLANSTIAAIGHQRFSTNSGVEIASVQPTSNFANNGENNAITQVTRHLSLDPSWAKLIGTNTLNWDGLSDSYAMSAQLDLLRIRHPKKSLLELISMVMPHQFESGMSRSKRFSQQLTQPIQWCGPTAMTAFDKHSIVIARDGGGLRPARLEKLDFGNGRVIYRGLSEIGCDPQEIITRNSMQTTTDINSEIYDIPAGKQFAINLSNGNIYEPDHKQTVSIAESQPDMKIHISPYSKEKKVAFGLTEEYEKVFLNPYLNRTRPMVSMHHGFGTDALNRDNCKKLSYCIYADFAQITNPPISKQEWPYINMHINLEPNRIIDSPILTPGQYSELNNLECAQPFYPISMVYNVDTRETGMIKRLDEICDEAIDVIENGVSIIELHDYDTNYNMAPIPALIVTARLYDRLLTSSLYDKASIVLSSGQILNSRDVDQLLGIGAVKAFFPWLLYSEAITPTHVNNLKYILTQELTACLGSRGIYNINCARGSKQFSAEGLSDDLLDILGIEGRFGGLTVPDIARINLTMHRHGPQEGLGRYSIHGSKERMQPWLGKTKAIIDIARKKQDIGTRANNIKILSDRVRRDDRRTNSFGMLKPVKRGGQFTNHKPLRVAICGGGYAGLQMALHLLKSSMPVDCTIFEKSLVNGVGSLYSGVSPLHEGTRKQSAVIVNQLREIEGWNYWGGENVNADDLKPHFNYVIDATGAEQTVLPNIPGQDLLIPAENIYRSYNGAFIEDSLNPWNPNPNEKHWPFPINTLSPTFAALGFGNVLADIIQMFYIDEEKLFDKRVNPKFVRARERVKGFRVFVRGRPEDLKASTSEIKAVLSLPGVTTVLVNDHGPIQNPTQEQQQRRDLFTTHQTTRHPRNSKRLYIHFNSTPTQIISRNKGENEITVSDTQSPSPKTTIFTTGPVIACMGRSPSNDGKTSADMAVGWRTGKGGALPLVRQDINEKSSQLIKKFYRKERFRDIADESISKPWEIRSLIDKTAFLRVFDHLQQTDGFILSIHDLRSILAGTISNSDAEETGSPCEEPDANINSNPSHDSFVYESEDSSMQIKATNDTLMNTIPTETKEHGSCGGEGTCMECAVDVYGNNAHKIKQPEFAVTALRAMSMLNTGKNKNTLLSCQIPSKDVVGLKVKPQQ